MVQWKMSCHLMEEPPVAAGRSVATGAMCVNLLPCHFFSPPPPRLPTRLPLHLRLPPPASPLWTPLPLPTVACDKLLLAADLLVVKSVPRAAVKGRGGGWWVVAGRGCGAASCPPHHPTKCTPTPCFTCCLRRRPPSLPLHLPHTHTRGAPPPKKVGVETLRWKLIFCPVRSHQIRCCPCLIGP